MVEVLAMAVIMALLIAALQRVLLSSEQALTKSRVEAEIGRTIRYHANILTNCPYDQLPAEGTTTLESWSALRVFESGAWVDRLPADIDVVRSTTDAGLDSETTTLTLSVRFTNPADASSINNDLQTRQRSHPAITRRPATAQ